MKIRNRVLLGFAASVMVSLCVFGSAYAYSTWRAGKTNKFQIGTNVIEIEENGDKEHGDNTILSNGDVITKDVRVTNTGNIPCYVRVFLEFSNGDAADVSTLSADGTNYYTEDEFKEKSASNSLGNNWVYSDSTGYYYYNKALDPGETTTSLIKSVKTDFDSADSNISSYDIIVHSESVQTKLHNGKDASDYGEAWSQFLSRK